MVERRKQVLPRQMDLEDAIDELEEAVNTKLHSSAVTARVEQLEEFRERIGIDRDNLDENVFEQPDLFFRVSEQVSLYVSRRDKKKYELELEEAGIDRALRKKFEAAERKITDKGIMAEVQSDPDIVRLREQLLGVQAELGKWNALKEAFEHRKDMLKVAGQLYASNYFTRSSTSGAKQKIDETDADRNRGSAGTERRNRMPD